MKKKIISTLAAISFLCSGIASANPIQGEMNFKIELNETGDSVTASNLSSFNPNEREMDNEEYNQLQVKLNGTWKQLSKAWDYSDEAFMANGGSGVDPYHRVSSVADCPTMGNLEFRIVMISEESSGTGCYEKFRTTIQCTRSKVPQSTLENALDLTCEKWDMIETEEFEPDTNTDTSDTKDTATTTESDSESDSPSDNDPDTVTDPPQTNDSDTTTESDSADSTSGDSCSFTPNAPTLTPWIAILALLASVALVLRRKQR